MRKRGRVTLNYAKRCIFLRRSRFGARELRKSFAGSKTRRRNRRIGSIIDFSAARLAGLPCNLERYAICTMFVLFWSEHLSYSMKQLVFYGKCIRRRKNFLWIVLYCLAKFADSVLNFCTSEYFLVEFNL